MLEVGHAASPQEKVFEGRKPHELPLFSTPSFKVPLGRNSLIGEEDRRGLSGKDKVRSTLLRLLH